MNTTDPRRLRSWSEAEDKTIRTVIETPGDDLTICCSAFIVFDCDCWMTLHAQSHGDDEASLTVGVDFAPSDNSFLRYITPKQALVAHLINSEQFKFAEQKRDEQRSAKVADRAARLRKELARIEGSKAG